MIVVPIKEHPRRNRRNASWHALLGRPRLQLAPHGGFGGSREDALAWAHNTGARQILVDDSRLADLVEVT
jgi:hypothetical protein